jgi:hypothetical protein
MNEEKDDYVDHVRLSDTSISDEIIAIRNERIDIEDCIRLKAESKNRIKLKRATSESKASIFEELFGFLPLKDGSNSADKPKPKSPPPSSKRNDPKAQVQDKKSTKPLLTLYDKYESKIPSSPIPALPPATKSIDLAKRQREWLARLELTKNIRKKNEIILEVNKNI